MHWWASKHLKDSRRIPAAEHITSSLFIRQLSIRLNRDSSIDEIRNAPVYHLGLFREKATLQPVECENSRLDFQWMINSCRVYQITPNFHLLRPVTKSFYWIPWLRQVGPPKLLWLWSSSGVFLVRYPHLIRKSNSRISTVNKIKLLSILASEEGLRNILAEYPQLEVGLWAVLPAGEDQWFYVVRYGWLGLILFWHLKASLARA